MIEDAKSNRNRRQKLTLNIYIYADFIIKALTEINIENS